MPNRLLRTSGFQIAILYLVLLGVTLVALIAFVYWSTSALIDRQLGETIEAEIRGLAEQYRDEGLPRLMEIVRERSGPGGNPQNVYLLSDPSFQPLTGNLAHWPEGQADADDWLEIRLERSGDDSGAPHIVRGRTFDLAGGFHLFVGRDTVERGDFRRILAEALAWAAIPALLFGLFGGVLIGRYTLRRVDAVRAAGEDIVKGNLSRRVPLTGSGDEFDRLAATINEMLDRIDTLMGGMRLVTDSLAHDLRVPLTRARSSIEQALQTAGREAGDAEILKDALGQTSAELETILRTFEALINIAQAEAGVSRIGLVSLDLSALAQTLFEVYQPIAEDAGLDLRGELGGAITVIGHRELLAQAIANLLDNAIKHTPPGGRVSVTVRPTGNAAEISVCDTGPGIPASERWRVLQRFVRLDSSRGTPGSGLGLSLVAAVATLHGARLELADNAPGLRATVSFTDGRDASVKSID